MANELGDGRRALRGDTFVGVTRASRELGLATRWLRQAIARGDVPSYVFGQRTRVKVTDLRAWLERHRRP